MNEKRKVGRPIKENKDKKVRMTYISDEDYAFYSNLGSGNFSKGLHEAKNLLSLQLKKSS